MKQFSFVLLCFTFYFNPINAQETSVELKKRLFLNSKGEYHNCLSIDGVWGLSNLGPSTGLMVSLDIYHILVGYKLMANGYWLQRDYYQTFENSFYLGYQYRKEKIMTSVAAGLGTSKAICTSGTGGNCYDVIESWIPCVPIKLEFDFLISPKFGIGASGNFTIAENSNVFSCLFHMKCNVFWNKDN